MFAEAGLLGALKRLLDPSEASMVRAAALACLDALLGFTEVSVMAVMDFWVYTLCNLTCRSNIC